MPACSLSRLASQLKPAPPLVLVVRLALDNQNTGPMSGSQLEEAVEVGPTRERGVDDYAETEAKLGGGDLPDGMIGEVVEEGRGGGGCGGDERVLEG